MSKKNKFIVAGVTSPQERLTKNGTSYTHPDTFLVTVAPTLADAKAFIEEGHVVDANAMQYLVIEELKELTTNTKISRWYICKDNEITQLAQAPEEYKNYTSMISM